MKKLVFVGLVLIHSFSYSFGQEYCENFKIVSIIDFPPSPQTPGGNFFLLLLTVHEDNPSNSTIYANLFFVDEFGDTISIPTGPSSHLPVYATDTIPYILELNSTNNNQDFPTSFNGKLVILHPSHPECEVSFSNALTIVNSIVSNNIIAIFPNPFIDIIKIRSEKQIERIVLTNSIGKTVRMYSPKLDSYEMNLVNIKPGVYSIAIQFENGGVLQRKIVKL